MPLPMYKIFFTILVILIPSLASASLVSGSANLPAGSAVLYGDSGYASFWVFNLVDDVGATYATSTVFSDTSCSVPDSLDTLDGLAPDIFYSSQHGFLINIDSNISYLPYQSVGCVRTWFYDSSNNQLGVYDTVIDPPIYFASTTINKIVSSSTPVSNDLDIIAINISFFTMLAIFFICFIVTIWIWKLLTA